MTRALLFLAVVLAGAAGCSPTGTFCQAQADCDDFGAQFPLGLDQVGNSDDSIDVCIADNDGFVRELRANEEKDCQKMADAWEVYMACAANEYAKDQGNACDPFTFGNNNPCDDELRDFNNASQDAGGACSPDET